jgi:anti-sigma regulatory factor (Ser/Thr protein kinase)
MTADPEGSSTVRAWPGVVGPLRGATSLTASGWRGPGWRVFSASPGHGRHVRDWITRVVSRRGCSADPDDAALLVSELFVNALMHGPAGGRVLVGYCLWSGGARIIVCDAGGATTPRLRDPGEMEEGGRGLQVVEAVAAAWGSFRTGRTQAVWFDLGKPLDACASNEALAWLRAALAAGVLAAPAGGVLGSSSVPDADGPVTIHRQEATGATRAGAPAVAGPGGARCAGGQPSRLARPGRLGHASRGVSTLSESTACTVRQLAQ